MIAAAFAAAASAGDELRLKDGTKVAGTIVGFEGNSFKVRTSYGYALVRKDAVATIAIAESEEKPDTAAKSAAPVAATAAPTAPPAQKAASNVPAPPKVEPSPAASVAKAEARAAPAPTVAAKPAPAPTPVGQAAAQPAPEPMHEQVEGNSYLNLTYGFRMYKPPSWHVIEGAAKTLPNAIVAMGTDDETTLLVVGSEPLRGSLAAQATATEARLRDTYENFRATGEEKTTISGLPAVEHRFRGTVDAHDWSGRVVWLARGHQVYTLMGLTYADSDPILQVRENIVARAIASLEFTKQ